MSQETLSFLLVLGILIDLGIKVAVVFLLPRNRKPSAAMAWILAVFLIPYLGLIFFVLIGSPKLPKRRRNQQERINTILMNSPWMAPELPPSVELPAALGPIIKMNRLLGSMPFTTDNTAELESEYGRSISAMTADISRSTNYVHVEFYIVSFDSTTAHFFDAMASAVKRGVKVRLLMDHFAAKRAVGHRETLQELDRIRVEWQYMLPVRPLHGQYQRPDLRNHRKLLVVDGHTAYLGSQNLIDRSYNSQANLKRGLQWQELTVRLTGPTVRSINALFLTDWFSETGTDLRPLPEIPADPIRTSSNIRSISCQIIPSGPGFPGENNLRLFLALMYSAQKQIIITSPYFVPDEAMMYAITAACQRGVIVELFVSEIGDQALIHHAQQSYYGELLMAGVTIWLYPPPFILHAKHLSIDDDIAIIGSSNMDIRSFTLNLEVSLLVHGKSFVDDMRRVEAGYRTISRQLSLEEYRGRPLHATALDGVARLTSALQ